MVSKKKNNNIIFLLSFPETSNTILEYLYEEYAEKLIICYTRNSETLAKHFESRGLKVYPIESYFVLLKKVIPSIQGTKIVLADNYFAFFAGMSLTARTRVIQLWHANGAIKKFGLEAKYVSNKSRCDKKRYKKVYGTFTDYVLSSEKMRRIFEKNFQESIRILSFGYPQTDYYFDEKLLNEDKKRFIQKIDTNKKVLLYAPTYREDMGNFAVLTKETLEQLSKDWCILVKLHPHDVEKNKSFINIPGVITKLEDFELKQILPSVDCLITDYSSIPFEYSLANPKGRMIFYCPDFIDYKNKVGIEDDFLEWIPGVLVTTEVELIREIYSMKEFSMEIFNERWNEYAKGNSHKQLIEWMNEYND
ncbi:CDP-glycerol glycerophosphotransferase family protein [Enterococcus sp. LJL98]